MSARTLAGQIALVTGGSGDIGRGIAVKLAEAGATVGVTYLGFDEGANATLAEIEAAGGEAHSYQLDQRDPHAIDACAKAFSDEHGRLDVLVNNAGWNVGIPFTDLDALDADTWDRVLETNLRGPFLLARALSPLLKAQGGGHVINIASIGGIAPVSSSIAYSSSKAGLIHLTRCLAVAMAPEVAVNCVAPGLVEDTRMARRLPPEVSDMARAQAVRGCVGQVEDIATQVVSFASSRSVSGQIVAVDGGMPVAMR